MSIVIPGFTGEFSVRKLGDVPTIRNRTTDTASMVVPARPTCEQCDSGPCRRNPDSSECKRCHCACGIVSECPPGGGGSGCDCPCPPRSCQKAPLGVWGNWCGPNCGDGPTCDDVDNCCYHHDKCYDKFHNTCYQSCICDIQLIRCLTPKIDPTTLKGSKATEMVAIFSQKVASGLCNPNPICGF